LLLLDEATASLDQKSETQVLENLRRYGVAVLLVTHRIPVREFADRDLRLVDGRLIEDAGPSSDAPDDRRFATVSDAHWSES
jgi:putative ABC transport system ATP-binding protein